ncbi:MAG: hypothetical protein V4760_10335 [Bdellovibrionota bacterium]
MINRAPPGWRHNPSSFTRRARLASIAAIAALLVTQLSIPSALAGSTSLVLVVCGALSLIGGSHRWATRPWLITLLGILAIPVSLTNTALVALAYFEALQVDAFELAFIGLTTAFAGAVLDEILAMTQMIRRQTDHGRSLWKAFFGLRSRRRNGRAVTLDDVLTREGEQPP